MDDPFSSRDPPHRSRSRTRRQHGHRPIGTRLGDYRSSPTKYPRKSPVRMGPVRRSPARRSPVKKPPDLGPVPFKRTKLPKYSKGYHALLAVIKDLRELREKRESTEPQIEPLEEKEKTLQSKEKSMTQSGRRSRSYSRGRSVYYEDSGPLIPYYRSKSVDRVSRPGSNHGPVVNEHDIIRLTYTGSSPASASSRSSRARSRRGSGTFVYKRIESVPPHRRSSYTFDDLLTRIFQEIQHTYGEPDADVKQKQFFRTLALIQMQHHKMKKMNLSKSDRMFLEKTFEEVKDLKSETNKVLRDSHQRYDKQNDNNSPVNKQYRNVQYKRPPEDTLLHRQRTRGRLKLKPIDRNMSAEADRMMSHDYYIRRRNAEVQKQQSRHYSKFEANRTALNRVPKHSYSSYNVNDPIRRHKPLTKLSGPPGRLVPHQQNAVASQQPHPPQHQRNQQPSQRLENTYRSAKNNLMLKNRDRPELRASFTNRESPGTVAMSETLYRHRMHGAAK